MAGGSGFQAVVGNKKPVGPRDFGQMGVRAVAVWRVVVGC